MNESQFLSEIATWQNITVIAGLLFFFLGRESAKVDIEAKKDKEENDEIYGG